MSLVSSLPGAAPSQFYAPVLPYNFIDGKSYSDKGDYKKNHHGNYYPSNMGQMTAPPPFINGMQTSQTSQNSQNDRETQIKRFILLVLPFLIFSPETAAYFGATELIGQYLTDLGVSDGWSLIILLFIQCVDMKALLRGRFKFVEGWNSNYYGEIWDTAVGRMGFGDVVRIGSQYFLPQSPAPTYED